MLSNPLAILLCTIFCIDYIMPLELTELRVPTHIPLGIRAILLCRWALRPSEALYSVKWYKDGKEFFRHVPNSNESHRKFLLPGVNVEKFDLSGSNLTLAAAVLTTSGRYRCEVSGERPHFHTVSKYADMLVVDLPTHGPIILGFKSQYCVGDHVKVNCSSGQSKLAMKLAWYINGEHVLPSVTPKTVYSENNPDFTNLELEFTIVKSLVGNLKLQCVATIVPIYSQVIEKNAIVYETLGDIKNARILESTVSTYPRNVPSAAAILQRQHVIILLGIYYLYII